MGDTTESATTTFVDQRRTLEAALSHYDDLVAHAAEASSLARAEHKILLASKALTTQLTPPGVYALNAVFPVSC